MVFFSDEEYISHNMMNGQQKFEAIYINPDTNLWAPAASVINTTPDPPAPH